MRWRREPDWRPGCVRAVSEVMDQAPEWREWFAYQLALLDLEYDPRWWLTLTEVKG